MQPQNNDPDFKVPLALRHRSLTRRKPLNVAVSSASAVPSPEPLPLKRSKLHFLDPRQKWGSLRTRHKVIVILTALIVVVAGGLISRNLLGNESNPLVEINKKEAEKTTTVPSPLTGVQVSPDDANRPVTAIMIENSREARPQSGLQNAGVVFEAIAEGGITRFLALYQEGQPPYVGPIRSLRSYYIDWAGSFDAPIAHVGGSPAALDRIRTGGKDLDQFFNAGSYMRISSRPSPHNVFTSFEKLNALNNSKGYTSSKFDSWPRKEDQPAQTLTASSIDIGISSAPYNSHYNYDTNSNKYLRSQGGAPHISTASESGEGAIQLQPKVLVVMVMGFSIVDGDGHGGYDTIGSGPVYVFQDGGATHGSWSKSGPPKQFVLKDDNGQPIKLNTGQTWVAVIQANQLNYSP